MSAAPGHRTSADPTVGRLIHTVLQPGFAGSQRPPDWLTAAVERGLGGVVYFSHNIGDVATTRGLSDRLHDAGEVLIATDEEGGIVSRLGARDGSQHVGAAALGRADDVAATREVGGAIGADLRASGIDVDLAPVVDVNSNPDNPVIGVRSFGATAPLVARHAVAYAAGLQSVGVAATAKHFPGHGDTAVDSHVGVPRVDASLEVMRERELAPFAAIVSSGVRAVMTAHVIVPAIDPRRPATISPTVLSVLRRDLGFDGVIISDALDMGAIRDTIGLGEGCVQALLAGADVLGLGNPVLGADRPDKDLRVFTEAYDALLHAVQDHRLPVDRLEEAAERIDALRAWRRAQPTSVAAGTSADRSVARRALARRGAVTLPHGPLQLLDVRRLRNVAAGALPATTVQAIVEAHPGSTITPAFALPAAVEGHADRDDLIARDDLPVADVIVTGSPGHDVVEDEQRRKALAANPDALVVVLGYARGDEPLDGARRAIWTFGDSVPTARAVAELLAR
ncbi:glycoside hydrolase family 3 protein [Flexivirga oryzae]|uniref:Beta-N-acetylhexosaminidase n=1 Tax=Flexivirga oryzae TaxID=1794944 RepID=A0A839N8D3_9MICO|nr:glycoside hydrolase family 3 N-terminal domain-containing protein [Flexivirga oryzae]MBB2891011.1 beta-N-acetylhexosaminidase [Flexivirga oryzae]